MVYLSTTSEQAPSSRILTQDYTYTIQPDKTWSRTRSYDSAIAKNKTLVVFYDVFDTPPPLVFDSLAEAFTFVGVS